jgi:hypothetical protein
MAAVARPINEALYRLGVRTRTQHRNVIAALPQYEALQAASWFYGVLSATKR